MFSNDRWNLSTDKKKLLNIIFGNIGNIIAHKVIDVASPEYNKNTIIILLKSLTVKKLIRIDKLTTKNIYSILSLGNQKLGHGNKTIKIDYNELIHQDLLSKWLVQQNDIVS